MADDWDEDYSLAYEARAERELAAQARQDWLISAAIIGPMAALTAGFGVLAWLT